jgi:methylenetetrahydrofolate reductase (NADPH)
MPSQPLVHELLAAEEKGKFYFSFEFFPPKTDKGEEALRAKLHDYAKQQPVFMDFTWGAGGTTSEQTPKWVKYVADELHIAANMHLTCTNMPEGKVHEALEFCKANGIRNLVALRGDPPAGQEWKASADGFACALDLVKYIRANYGDYFSICVAGYPEGHPDVIPKEGLTEEEDMKKEIAYLKQKIDAGANAVITQLFYNVEHFKKFVTRCREAGITVPILPGILPMVTYAGLKRMVQLCKTDVPAAVLAKTEELKDDEAAFKAYGIELATQMCVELRDFGIHHFHFYTLNQEHSTFTVLKNLGFFKHHE